MRAFNCGDNCTSQRILYWLEAMNRTVRQGAIKGVAIIKFGGNQSVGKAKWLILSQEMVEPHGFDKCDRKKSGRQKKCGF